MPTIYRRWIATRFRRMKLWVNEWAHQAMCAGVESVSTEYAWYCTALQFEHARIMEEIIAGANIEISKCVESYLRSLL